MFLSWLNDAILDFWRHLIAVLSVLEYDSCTDIGAYFQCTNVTTNPRHGDKTWIDLFIETIGCLRLGFKLPQLPNSSCLFSWVKHFRRMKSWFVLYRFHTIFRRIDSPIRVNFLGLWFHTIGRQNLRNSLSMAYVSKCNNTYYSSASKGPTHKSLRSSCTWCIMIALYAVCCYFGCT